MNEQLQKEIHGIFANILKIDTDFDDDVLFIELGGQSILMGELQNEIHSRYNALIPFEKLLNSERLTGCAILSMNITETS